jgi:signal transduction histidine kinase
LYKNKVETKHLVYIFLLSILSYLLGQRTSRFYFEPLIWGLLLLNLYSKRYFNSRYLKYSVFTVALLQLTILAFSSYSLSSGLISISQREKVLTSKANGYTLAKWANLKLPDTARILIDHRSLAFFNQKVYSSDWVNYIENKSGQDKFYTDYLKKENVKYILIIGDKQEDSKLFSYCDSLLYGPFKGQVATRNPLNSGKKYNAWIYTSKF